MKYTIIDNLNDVKDIGICHIERNSGSQLLPLAYRAAHAMTHT